MKRFNSILTFSLILLMALAVDFLLAAEPGKIVRADDRKSRVIKKESVGDSPHSPAAPSHPR